MLQGWQFWEMADLALWSHAGIHTKPTMFVAQHIFSLKALQQAPAREGAQDAAAQGGLHLGHGGLIDAAGRVENYFAG